MDNLPSDSPSLVSIAVIMTLVLIALGIAIPAISFQYRSKETPEKFPQFMRRVFLRRRK